MAEKKFLVTGATGDTGGYTVEQLLERGRRLRPFCRPIKKGAEPAVYPSSVE